MPSCAAMSTQRPRSWKKDGQVEDILFGLEKVSFTAGGRRVEEKKITLEEKANYLVRLGIAGPAGILPALLLGPVLFRRLL